MEREAFARAWRFLSFKPVAKWTAQVAAVATAVLYVAFLIVLALFADLAVHRGRLPSFEESSSREQADFLRRWQNASTDPAEPLVQEKGQRLQDIGVPDKKAAELAAADVHNLPPDDRELLWRAYMAHVLANRVGPNATSVVTAAGADWDPSDRALMALVVRSHARFYGPLVAALARWLPLRLFHYLTWLLIFAVALALLRVVAMFLMNYMAAAATTEAANRMRRAIYHHSFRLGTLAIRALGPSEAVGIFTKQVETVHNGLYVWLTVVCREPVKFVLLVAFALAVNFWLALAFLIFAVLVWLVGGQVATYFRRQERVAISRAAEQLALLQESLMMMRLVKCYLMELFNQSRIERQLSKHAAAQMRRYRGEALYSPLLICLGTLAALVLFYVAGRVVLQGDLGVPSIITLSAALVSLYLPVVTWLEQRRLLRRCREAAVVLFKFLDRPGEVGQVVGAEFLPPMTKRLEFEDVTLREPGTGRRILQGVNLTVHAGQRVALVGPDEMEKHALVYLVPRFLDPESGEIRIDGQNLRWVTFDSLRAQTAIVLQHNLVFNDTVANNIGCGDTSYTLPKIIEAAKVAHAHQFVQKLPKGYETLIGELGHALSISERFRIALARAVLRDPALLIIEEPVAALDDDTKALIDDTFTRVLPGRSVIFLPHRISTIRSCDQVFLLNKGKIEAAGDHRDLLARNQLYRHLQYLEFNEFADQV